MTWTKEREEKVRKAARSAAGVSRGVAQEILSWLDAEREARQRAEAQVTAMKLRALAAHAAVWAAMQTDGSAADAVKDGGAVHEAIHSILAVAEVDVYVAVRARLYTQGWAGGDGTGGDEASWACARIPRWIEPRDADTSPGDAEVFRPESAR